MYNVLNVNFFDEIKNVERTHHMAYLTVMVLLNNPKTVKQKPTQLWVIIQTT